MAWFPGKPCRPVLLFGANIGLQIAWSTPTTRPNWNAQFWFETDVGRCDRTKTSDRRTLASSDAQVPAKVEEPELDYPIGTAGDGSYLWSLNLCRSKSAQRSFWGAERGKLVTSASASWIGVFWREGPRVSGSVLPPKLSGQNPLQRLKSTTSPKIVSTSKRRT